MGMSVLFIVSFNCVLYSAESGVKRVAVDLSAFSMRLFSWVHAKRLFRYG